MGAVPVTERLWGWSPGLVASLRPEGQAYANEESPERYDPPEDLRLGPRRVPTLGECDDSRLCHELSGSRKNIAFYEIYQGDPATRLIDQSPNFALLADISPLVEGHLLLVPKRHFNNFGLCALEPTLASELSDFREISLELVQARYGPVTILEHGSSPYMGPTACVTHAHWHLVPNAERILRVFEHDELVGSDLDSWTDLALVGDRDAPYIYCRTPSIERFYDKNLSKRHQYLRVALAETFDIDEPLWDWGLHTFTDHLRSTVKALTADVEERNAQT